MQTPAPKVCAALVRIAWAWFWRPLGSLAFALFATCSDPPHCAFARWIACIRGLGRCFSRPCNVRLNANGGKADFGDAQCHRFVAVVTAPHRQDTTGRDFLYKALAQKLADHLLAPPPFRGRKFYRTLWCCAPADRSTTCVSVSLLADIVGSISVGDDVLRRHPRSALAIQPAGQDPEKPIALQRGSNALLRLKSQSFLHNGCCSFGVPGSQLVALQPDRKNTRGPNNGRCFTWRAVH